MPSSPVGRSRSSAGSSRSCRSRPYSLRVDDAELAQLAATGDRGAWSAIYDRYADRLHDYCWSILRDRHEAEDALHDAFVTAASKIGQLRDPALLRPWLYAICRNQALAKTRRRGREVPSEDVADMTPPVSDRSDYEVEELRRLVWAAAGGLAPRDRSVFELHLRHNLDGKELAEALGTNAHHATVMLSRVRDHVERSLGALLVGRTGRKDCAELDGMLANWDGELTPLLRKRVARHIDNCTVCTEQRRRMVSPLALLSGVPLLPAPRYLRERVLQDIELVNGGTPLDDVAGGGASGGGGAGGGIRRAIGDGRVKLVIGAATLTVLAMLGAVLFSGGPGGEPANLGATVPSSQASPAPASTSGSAGSSSTTGAPSSVPSTTTAAPAPAALGAVTTAVDFGAASTQQALRFRNTGGQPMPWSVSSGHRAVTVQPASGNLAPGATAQLTVRLDRGALAEGDFAGRLRLSAASTTDIPVTAAENRPPRITDLASSRAWLVAGTVGIDCQSTQVSAAVTDDTPVTVTLSWQQGGGRVIEGPMSLRGGRYSAPIAITPSTPGAEDIRWWVTATDQRGNTSRSPDQGIDVRSTGPCPS